MRLRSVLERLRAARDATEQSPGRLDKQSCRHSRRLAGQTVVLVGPTTSTFVCLLAWASPLPAVCYRCQPCVRPLVLPHPRDCDYLPTMKPSPTVAANGRPEKHPHDEPVTPRPCGQPSRHSLVCSAATMDWRSVVVTRRISVEKWGSSKEPCRPQLVQMQALSQAFSLRTAPSREKRKKRSTSDSRAKEPTGNGFVQRRS